ncbi:Gfo/Idh/MocA family protein [Paractinoplanes atraurantiacus]|uniref:Gfo/Idh/MocA family protein n=1 Tax=Paractinoplanes atraurantiacus TaxID=1036182 RepID=UPI000BE4015A|nr:Gfo/Idh/MocA family oxidoreductase [Actinoplanes atraurantiacus]
MAVIGLGTVSVVHLAALSSLGLDLVATSEGRYRDHRVLLDEVRPDAVHICTPHDQHVPVALDALARGVHVLLEKPVAHTVAAADELLAAAKDNPSVAVGVCLQNRYNLASVAARELLLSGSLGPVIGASATVMWHRDDAYYQARPWRGQMGRSGGGVLINQAIHTLDLLQWLLGDVTDISSQIGHFAGREVEDTVTAVLDHARVGPLGGGPAAAGGKLPAPGARSVFFSTVANAVDSPVTIEITTAAATLVIRGDLTIRHADGRVEVIAERRAESGGRDYWGASHELLIADFYRRLRTGEAFAIDLEEGMKSLRLVDEIYRQNI